MRCKGFPAALFLAAAIASPAIAATAPENVNDRVVVNERTVRFEISARNFDDFKRRLKRYSLKEFGDSKHVASTTTHIYYALKAREQIGGCALYEYSVTANIEYALPLWIEHERAGPNGAKRWRSFYAKARLHEKDHGRISKSQAREVAVILSELGPADDCDKMISTATAAAEAYLDENKAQQEYDKHTRRDPSRRESFDFEAAVRRR